MVSGRMQITLDGFDHPIRKSRIGVLAPNVGY